MYGILICCIDVRLSRGYSNLHFVLVITLARADDTEISVDFVITLRSPRHIMYVGKLVVHKRSLSRS